jgi:hypothetical protein
MRVIRERLEVKRRQETTQIEERKNAQIESLMKVHPTASRSAHSDGYDLINPLFLLFWAES